MPDEALQTAFEIKTTCDEISRKLLRWHWENKPGEHSLGALLDHIRTRQQESPEYYDRLPDLAGRNSWQQLDTTLCMRVLLDPEKDAARPLDLLGNTAHPAAARRACNAVQMCIRDRTPLSSSMVETLTNLQKISGPDADKYKGIPTGFRLLDTVLTGLGRGDLIILAARPGMGKTSFALNIATRVAMQQKVPVAIFSLEMTKEQLTNRILSAEAGIDSQAFRTGALRSEDWEYLALATEKLHDAPIYMDDTSGITITEMKAKIRRVNQDPTRPNVGLIVIDYLQLMTTGQRSENRVQEISSITRNLKIMAKEMNVPIIALSQLSRAVEKQGNNSSHRPQLSDLRDSGSIEQDADCVLFLYRDSYYASQSPDGAEVDADTAECIVAKNRHGETSTVPLGWDGAHTRFMEDVYERQAHPCQPLHPRFRGLCH